MRACRLRERLIELDRREAEVCLRDLIAAAQKADRLWDRLNGNDRWSEDVGDQHLSAIRHACREIASRLRGWDLPPSESD